MVAKRSSLQQLRLSLEERSSAGPRGTVLLSSVALAEVRGMTMVSDHDPVIRIRNLRKSYDRFTLDVSSLEIEQGEAVGLIGENGAGKSTLIKLLLGIIRSDGGEIEWFGEDVLSAGLRERIGVTFDQCWFSDVLNLDEVERIMQNLYPRTWDGEMYFRLADTFGLPRKRKIAEYSSGMRAKLGILSAICHTPDLLLLDEPTNSLDPVMRRDVNRIMREFAKMGRKTVLFSSHIVNELEEFADSILLMKDGRIVLDSKVHALKTDYCLGVVPDGGETRNVPQNALAVLREDGCLLYLLEGRLEEQDRTMQIVQGVSLDRLMYFYERGERKNERAASQRSAGLD